MSILYSVFFNTPSYHRHMVLCILCPECHWCCVNNIPGDHFTASLWSLMKAIGYFTCAFHHRFHRPLCQARINWKSGLNILSRAGFFKEVCVFWCELSKWLADWLCVVLSLCSTLSSCVHAVVALLYPLSWQHTFIPVLPTSMVDIVCCPTPFLVGILSSSLPKLKDLPVEEVRTSASVPDLSHTLSQTPQLPAVLLSPIMFVAIGHYVKCVHVCWGAYRPGDNNIWLSVVRSGEGTHFQNLWNIACIVCQSIQGHSVYVAFF